MRRIAPLLLLSLALTVAAWRAAEARTPPPPCEHAVQARLVPVSPPLKGDLPSGHHGYLLVLTGNKNSSSALSEAEAAEARVVRLSSGSASTLALTRTPSLERPVFKSDPIPLKPGDQLQLAATITVARLQCTLAPQTLTTPQQTEPELTEPVQAPLTAPLASPVKVSASCTTKATTLDGGRRKCSSKTEKLAPSGFAFDPSSVKESRTLDGDDGEGHCKLTWSDEVAVSDKQLPRSLTVEVSALSPGRAGQRGGLHCDITVSLVALSG